MRDVYYDELTGCYNRRYLHYWIDNEIKRANRFATKFALIMLDIDDFRNINNNYGHPEGDRALIEFSAILQKDMREVDNLVRYGGDEFIILMPNTDKKGVVELAQRIIDKLNTTDVTGHGTRCSIGFAVFPEDGKTQDELINHADSLMYEAKKQGKNRIGWKLTEIKKLQIPSVVTVGRDDELTWCLNQLQEYNTVLIAGEAGIGKTRLVLEVRKRLGADLLLRGNSYAALSTVPYHPFKNMLHEFSNTNYALLQRAFKRIPESFQAEVLKLLPTGSIMKMAQSESLDKYRLYSAVSEFVNQLAALSSSEATLVLLDDLHWLDTSSCELLDFLMRSLHRNIKIFGTYRTEEVKNSPLSDFLSIWAREKTHSQIALSPLTEEQSTQLLKEIMGNIPHTALKYIYKESGGNPFYTEELLRELENRKKLYWDGHAWALSGTIEGTIPRSIEETIKRKLKFLDPEIESFLKITAVFGQEVIAEIIAIASKRNVGQIVDAFDELSRLGFIKERTRDTFFFSEDIVRQIVYKNMSRVELIEYHNAVGKAIEVYYRDSLPNYFEQLALHFTIANDVTKALYYSKQAAKSAKENYAHSTAIRFFENALKYEDKLDEIFSIKFALAETYALTGQYDRATQALDVCLKINPSHYRTYEKLGNISESKGDYRASLKHYETGLRMTQGTDAVFTFRSAIAWLYTRLGQYSRGKKECEDMLRKKNRMGKQALGDAYIILGVIGLRMGNFRQAETWIRKALKIRESIGDKTRIAACYLDLGLNYYQKYNFKLAEQFYKKALRMYETIGHQENILVTLNNLGALYAYYDLPKAEAFYLKALKQAKLIGARRTIVYLHNNLGSIEFNRMMHDQALLNYKQSLKLAKAMNFHEGIIFSSLDLSEFYREKGQVKRGRVYLEQALREARALDMKYLTIDCLEEEVEYLLLAQDIKRAEALLKKILAHSRSEHSIAYKIAGYLYRGKMLTAQNRFKESHHYYNQALYLVKSLPANKAAGEVYYYKGMMYKRAGRLKESLKMFIEANRIFETIGHLRFMDKIERAIAQTSI